MRFSGRLKNQTMVTGKDKHRNDNIINNKMTHAVNEEIRKYQKLETNILSMYYSRITEKVYNWY